LTLELAELRGWGIGGRGSLNDRTQVEDERQALEVEVENGRQELEI